MAKQRQSTIAKLPPEQQEEQQLQASTNKEELLRLITKGGKSARANVEVTRQEKYHRLTLRIKNSSFERVQKACAAREINTPATSWITEAILEKLKKEHF